MTETLAWKRYRQNGDIRARDFLMALYLPLVKAAARKVGGGRTRAWGLDSDGLENVGRSALLTAIEKFRPGQNVKFGSWAYLVVCRKMYNAYHVDNSRGKDIVPLLFEDGRVGAAETFMEIAARYSASARADNISNWIDRQAFLHHLRGLSVRDRAIMIGRYEDEYTKMELGQRMGVSDMLIARHEIEALGRLRVLCQEK